MNKNRLFCGFTGLLVFAPMVAFGAYPVYQNANMGAVVPAQAVVPGQNSVVYLPTAGNGVVAANSAVAARQTRVTGALPRVGSNATTAGRQYYQPADYDRLADSGLYVGVSAAYSASVMGSMKADYAGEADSFIAPGAFKEADFKTDSVIPFQVSLGAAINSDLRIDFSYTRYSGLSYPLSVETADGAGGYVTTINGGGAITANAAMLNFYYNIDSYTGYIAGGSWRPYVGGGVGLAINTIADYNVYDNSFYPVVDEGDLPITEPGTLTGVSDIHGYHNGGSTEQIAFSLEAGVTTSLSGGLSLDIFARYANMGKIKTSGSIVVTETEWIADGYGEGQGPDDVTHITNWQESGRISTFDVGARLRLQF